MKITLIAEGSTKRDRKSLRWGLAFLAGDVLFDAFGRSDVFWENIWKYKIDLSGVRNVVISHEDWDHVDALGGFLRTRREGTRVYVCARTGRPLKALIKSNGGVLREIRGSVRIAPGIFSLGQMRADTGRGILYEQALVVKSPRGFSVVTGCAHPGIVPIVRRAVKIFGKKLYAVCGGFHMKDHSQEENQKIIAALQALGVKKVIPLHCTGPAARQSFRKAYGQNFVRLHEGASVIL